MDEQPIQVERQTNRRYPQLPPLEDNERMHTLAQAFGDFFYEILLRSHQVLRGKRRQSEFLCVHLQGGTKLPERLDVEITQDPFPSSGLLPQPCPQAIGLARNGATAASI